MLVTSSLKGPVLRKADYKSPLLCHIARAAGNAPMMKSAHTIHMNWGTRWSAKRSMVTGDVSELRTQEITEWVVSELKAQKLIREHAL
jgi:hypothetical protein